MQEPQESLFFDGPAEAKLIEELEKQSQAQIEQMRAHERVVRRVKVEATPGNASQRHELHLTGKTLDLSEGGCGAIFTAPLTAGDLYRLRFDPTAIDLPIVYAQAVRCRMISDESFEVGFRFFTRVHLASESAEQDLLG